MLGAPTPLNRTVTFRIWNNPTSTDAANRLYSESQMVTFVNGEFSVNLGTGTPVSGETNPSSLADIWNSKDMFLGITVDDGDPATVDPELAPRQQIVTTAFAFRAKYAETAQKVENGAITQAMLAHNSVTVDQIADHSIQSLQISPDAVDTSKIVNESIYSDDIKNGQVMFDDIGPNAVDHSKIVNESIYSEDLKDGQVLINDIAHNAIDSDRIINEGIYTHDIKNGQITLEDLAAAVKDSLCPMGTILSYAGDHAPAG